MRSRPDVKAQSPVSLDIAAAALLVAALALWWSRRRAQQTLEDLAVTHRRLDVAHEAHEKQWVAEGAYKEAIRKLDQQIGELHFELDGPAGADVDGPSELSPGSSSDDTSPQREVEA
jgi:hypothetical protein